MATSKRLISRYNLIVLLLVQAVILLWSCSGSRAKWELVSGFVWNTTYTIKYENNNGSDLTDSIFDIFHKIEKSLSLFDTTSVTGLINKGEDIEIDDCFKKVFEASKRINSITGGWFDPTVGPLSALWGFGLKGETDSPPSPEDVSAALEKVGLDSINIVNNRIIGNSQETSFDFSAIAKGFGCDEIALMLHRNGVDNFLVEIGGEVVCRGVNQRGEPWIVQIDSPLPIGENEKLHAPLTKIKLANCGIATSGNYRNFKEANGIRYGHTINPLTGYPAQSAVLSASVIAPSAMEADAFATAFMAMPPPEIEKTIKLAGNIDVLLVFDSGAMESYPIEGETFTRYSTGIKVNDSIYQVVATEGFPQSVR